jgi:sporulation protein YlmC with PRC-barrel domain
VQAKIGKHFAVAVEPTESPEKSGLLFGTDYLVSLKAPIAQTDSQLLGQMVMSKDGATVGQIDELMVDVAKGRIAYVLLREKGYLGTGGKWLPVPLQAMKWTDNGYVVDVAASDLDSMKRLDRTTFPSWIRKSDLKKLYDQFDVDPYWSS